MNLVDIFPRYYKGLPYHNAQHALMVSQIALDLWESSAMGKVKLGAFAKAPEYIQIAALYHDAGDYRPTSPDGKNIWAACRAYMQACDECGVESQAIVINAIKATRWPRVKHVHYIGSYVADADLLYGIIHQPALSELAQERGVPYANLLSGRREFLENHVWFTEAARNKYAELKDAYFNRMGI